MSFQPLRSCSDRDWSSPEVNVTLRFYAAVNPRDSLQHVIKAAITEINYTPKTVILQDSTRYAGLKEK